MLLVVHATTYQRGSIVWPISTGVFKASSGWLHIFCCRHGLRSISLQSESLSADTSGIFMFKNEFTSLIEKEGYT